jgi:hypothetical protein
MSLVEDRVVEACGPVTTDKIGGRALQKWEQCPPSLLVHHGKSCCRIAREWIFSTDYSQLNGEHSVTGPRWLRLKFAWGPSSWPLSWCEAVEQKTLDCGALAAVTQEIYTARGVKSYPAQLIQQYSETSSRHWQKNWEGKNIDSHWIDKEVIYHEGCAVATEGNEIKIWDATASWWVSPQQQGGYGGLLFIRVVAPEFNASPALRWGSLSIVPNKWQRIEWSR